MAHTNAADPIPERIPNTVLRPLSGTLSAWNQKHISEQINKLYIVNRILN